MQSRAERKNSTEGRKKQARGVSGNGKERREKAICKEISIKGIDKIRFFMLS